MKNWTKAIVVTLATAILKTMVAGAGEVRFSGIDVTGPSAGGAAKGALPGVVVHGMGTAGERCELQWSAELGESADWQPVGNATVREDGTFAVDAFGKPGFYRMAVPARRRSVVPRSGTNNNIIPTNSVIILKCDTSIEASNITTRYNSGKKLTATLCGSDAFGNVTPLSNKTVNVAFNGVTHTRTTDKNGEIQFSVSKVKPGTYEATLSFQGDATSAASSKSVRVKVQKASPTLSAKKKKTYKVKTKTKKYVAILKTNKGKALASKKLTLKVNGKTYKAKTNSKGKAIFKIKHLKKKGSFKAVVTFKGNAYFSKATKKVRLVVK